LTELTHLRRLLPVPVVVVVIEVVVAMSIILVLGGSRNLIFLGPRCLDSFPACAAHSFGIVKGVPILTVILVVAEMGLRNTPRYPLYNVDDIGKPFLKACNTIDGRLAFDIVAIEYPAQQFHLLKCRGEGVVRVCVPV
jgi:hypothetical protein